MKGEIDMMICPETFYEYNLKGKTAAQIMTIIRGLKQQIGRLKNIIEHPDYTSTICPSESTQLWCTRLYLERAKEALLEVGGTYTPSQVEMKAKEFEDNIPNISKVVFSIGGYFQGNETRTINVEGEDLRLWVEHSLIPTPSDFAIEKNFPMTKQEFLDGLYDLHIGEWRKFYNLKRFGYMVCDGTQWELEIHYSNDIKSVTIYGDNAYPYNFDKLQELFGIDSLDTEDDEDEEE